MAEFASFEEELLCSICREYYQEPNQLQCMHSFCKECLTGLLVKGIKGLEDSGQLRRWGVGNKDLTLDFSWKEICCPDCRRVTALGANGLNDLPKDFILCNIVLVLKELLSKGTIFTDKQKLETSECATIESKEEHVPSKACAFCPQWNLADKECFNCSKCYCMKCFKAFHSQRSALKKHSVNDLHLRREELQHGSKQKVTMAELTGSLETELSCCICIDIYKEPMQLQCCHSFCKDCLKDIMEKQLEMKTESLQSQNSEEYFDGNTIECPQCRCKSRLNGQKLESLSKNFKLSNIVSKYKSLAEFVMTTKKGSSESTKTEAEIDEEHFLMTCYICNKVICNDKFCLDCSKRFCTSCFKIYHRRRQELRKHRTEDFQHFIAPKQRLQQRLVQQSKGQHTLPQIGTKITQRELQQPRGQQSTDTSAMKGTLSASKQETKIINRQSQQPRGQQSTNTTAMKITLSARKHKTNINNRQSKQPRGQQSTNTLATKVTMSASKHETKIINRQSQKPRRQQSTDTTAIKVTPSVSKQETKIIKRQSQKPRRQQRYSFEKEFEKEILGLLQLQPMFENAHMHRRQKWKITDDINIDPFFRSLFCLLFTPLFLLLVVFASCYMCMPPVPVPVPVPVLPPASRTKRNRIKWKILRRK